MAVTQRFLFDTNFDTGSATPRAQSSAQPSAPEGKPAPATEAKAALHEAAVEQARAEGYAVGRKEGEAVGQASGFEAGKIAGQEEAQQADTQRVAEALAQIGQGVQELLDRHAKTAAESQSLALTGLRAALAKLYPVLAERHGLAEIEALLADCLGRLGEEPRVVVRVADTLYDTLDQRLGELARQSGFEGNFVLLSEPDLPAGDLRVEWADGGAERSASATAAEIDEILDRALGDDPAAAHMPDDATPSSDVIQEG